MRRRQLSGILRVYSLAAHGEGRRMGIATKDIVYIFRGTAILRDLISAPWVEALKKILRERAFYIRTTDGLYVLTSNQSLKSLEETIPETMLPAQKGSVLFNPRMMTPYEIDDDPRANTATIGYSFSKSVDGREETHVERLLIARRCNVGFRSWLDGKPGDETHANRDRGSSDTVPIPRLGTFLRNVDGAGRQRASAKDAPEDRQFQNNGGKGPEHGDADGDTAGERMQRKPSKEGDEHQSAGKETATRHREELPLVVPIDVEAEEEDARQALGRMDDAGGSQSAKQVPPLVHKERTDAEPETRKDPDDGCRRTAGGAASATGETVGEHERGGDSDEDEIADDDRSRHWGSHGADQRASNPEQQLQASGATEQHRLTDGDPQEPE